MDERQAHPEWEEKEYKPKSEAACAGSSGEFGSFSRPCVAEEEHPWNQVRCPPGTMWARDHSCCSVSGHTSGPPSCSQVDGKGGADTGTVEILKFSALFFFFFFFKQQELRTV